jgi:hypothetical protein
VNQQLGRHAECVCELEDGRTPRDAVAAFNTEPWRRCSPARLARRACVIQDSNRCARNPSSGARAMLADAGLLLPRLSLRVSASCPTGTGRTRAPGNAPAARLMWMRLDDHV